MLLSVFSLASLSLYTRRTGRKQATSLRVFLNNAHLSLFNESGQLVQHGGDGGGHLLLLVVG